MRSSPLRADMVSKSRNMSADMLFTPELLALMPPTICCVRSQSVRDFVTEIPGGATLHRCGVAQSSSSEPHRTGAGVAPPEISVTKSRTD